MASVSTAIARVWHLSSVVVVRATVFVWRVCCHNPCQVSM